MNGCVRPGFGQVQFVIGVGVATDKGRRRIGVVIRQRDVCQSHVARIGHRVRISDLLARRAHYSLIGQLDYIDGRRLR